MSIKLIAGLGNPGEKYKKTRHNAGFWFLDALSSDFRCDKKINAEIAEIHRENEKIILLKPLTFMNLSGDAIQKTLHFYKIPVDAMLVAHDELDFPAGIGKFKRDGGHGGHNGLRDIMQKVGQKNFLRLRIGIDHPGDAKQVANYVLKSPSKNEIDAINGVLYQAEKALDTLITQGFTAAAQQLHTNQL